LTLDGWIRVHRFLKPVAAVRRRIDEEIAAAVTPLAAPESWEEYVEEYGVGVPLLHSQAPVDLEPAGHAIVAVIRGLASDGPRAPLSQDAVALNTELQQDRLAARHVVDWLVGDDSWEPARPGLLRTAGWLTLSAALRPLVLAFGEWRDQDRWLRRYCPACGALPCMAQLVGVDPGRRRFLACGRCTSQWRYGRTGCPFCETESHRLSSLGVDDEGGLRVDYCESCRGYLKTYNGQGDEQVLLADWTSLHLDLLAHNRGLARMATSLYDLGPDLPDAPTVCRADSGPAEAGADVPAGFVQ